MARTLTRPMFRKGGMAQREKYMGGGIKTIRPKYMGGGMTGIMSGIVPDAGLTPRVGYADGPSLQEIIAAQELKDPSTIIYDKDYIQKLLDQKIRKLYQMSPGFGQQMPTPLTPTQRAIKGYLETNPEGAYDLFEIGKLPGFGDTNYRDLRIAQAKKAKEAGIDLGLGETKTGTSGAPGGGDPEMFSEPKKKQKIIKSPDVTSDKDELQNYMDMFEAAAGSDPDESRRSKYLELAKFGANLLAQPGGDLIGAVGKAAAPSIGGISKQMESDRDAKRQLRIAGVQAYLKDQDPGSIGKAVKDIMKANPSLTMQEALTLAMQTGSATKGATKESRIQEYANILLGSKGAPKDKRIARALAERIENSGLGFSNFEPLPEKPVDGEYYYDTNGKIYKGTEDGVVELNVKK